MDRIGDNRMILWLMMQIEAELQAEIKELKERLK